MNEFYQILKRIETCQNRAVLVTIVGVEGSSYRKAGTSMLIVNNEANIGMISGGCLENDIKARADQWFTLQTKDFEQLDNMTFTYDMRSENENDWGRSSGCNGMITVLLEPVTHLFQNQLIQIKHQMDQGHAAIILRKFDMEYCKKRAIIFEDGRVLGDDKDFKEFIHGTDFWTLPDKKWPNIYSTTHRVPPRLIIYGAGDDAVPLSELAVKLGWTVVVADFRAALCNDKRFPMADTCRVAAPQDVVIGHKPQDSVVVMTHDFQVDQIILDRLKTKDISYLGILGPKERTKRLLKNSAPADHIHSPVGMDIGAEGPGEIAVSIMAEVIKEYRKSPEKVRVAYG